ncbi:MAG: NAD-dependent epimerase/dehydratase family protein [Planctomycetota bacterium]|jgi:nucleoside-diphosphate-sugar epimerase
MKRAIVTGAGGFIGHHLTAYLKARGYFVRGVDIKRPEFENTSADEFLIRDLRNPLAADDAMQGGFDEVYALAADMGGMGFIAFNDADILRNNARINLNTIEAAYKHSISRYFFASSACVYPEHLQLDTDSLGLVEEDAYPAAPDTEYGWEKLFAERVALTYGANYTMKTRIARFHNVYGKLGTWTGGREKVPAAVCRKVIEKIYMQFEGIVRQSEKSMKSWDDKLQPRLRQVEDVNIDIWGDGEQTRSFLYIDDCLEGIYRLMHSPYSGPMNIGSDRAISINDLVQIVADIADVKVSINHTEGPQGVRGRNSDNTLSKNVLDWEPQTTLEDGMAITYRWIEQQIEAAL